MTIESAGSLYLDEARFLPASQAAARTDTENTASSRMSFADILERSRLDDEKTEQQAPKKPYIDKTDKLYEQCEALEMFLIKNLLSSMRNTVQKSGFIDEGFAGKIYEDMLYDEYAKDYTKHADFGLAELAYVELTGQRGKI
jgi:flagellar protein FlgJ